jgi:hypothetical protein
MTGPYVASIRHVEGRTASQLNGPPRPVGGECAGSAALDAGRAF